MEDTFQPPAEVLLLSKQAFLDRYRIEAPDWKRFDFGDSPDLDPTTALDAHLTSLKAVV